MKKQIGRLLPLLLAGMCLLTCNRPAREVTVKNFMTMWDSITPLENPDKGWYHHLHDNGPWRYEIRDDSIFHTFPGMDHIYLRLAWSYLEPEEGQFDWHLIDTIVEQYVPLGYGISFRISSKERRGYPEAVGQRIDGVNYATPYWVRQAGAQGVVVKSKGSEVLAWSPDWDDPVYLEKLDNFHQAFAERYDDKLWVRYVDVGSIGDYGEGHTHASTRIPPSVEEVKANMDIYLKNYAHTRIVVTDALLFWNKEEPDVQELYDYTVSNGITIRDDSPMVGWHMGRYTDTWSISHPHFYDPLFRDRPTILELQHYTAVKRDGNWIGRNGEDTLPGYGVPGAEFFRKSVELMHATYIGYHGYAEDFLNDNPELVAELLNRCGYWYFPVEARYPSVISPGSSRLQITWLNRGVAPAYDRYSLVVCLEQSNDHTHRIIIEDSGNREWLPGEEYRADYELKIPDHIGKGTYRLKYKLKELNGSHERDVLVALDRSAMDDHNYVMLGEVQVR